MRKRNGSASASGEVSVADTTVEGERLALEPALRDVQPELTVAPARAGQAELGIEVQEHGAMGPPVERGVRCSVRISSRSMPRRSPD
jgi:hypothetical protein